MSLLAPNIDARRLLLLLAGATFCYWLALKVLMHMPLPPQPPQPDDGLPKDKTVHFVLYGGLATLLLATLSQRARLRPAAPPKTTLGRYLAVFVFCAIHGYLEEFTQPLSGRTYDLSDFAADCLGAAAGSAAWFIIERVAANRAASAP